MFGSSVRAGAGPYTAELAECHETITEDNALQPVSPYAATTTVSADTRAVAPDSVFASTALRERIMVCTSSGDADTTCAREILSAFAEEESR